MEEDKDPNELVAELYGWMLELKAAVQDRRARGNAINAALLALKDKSFVEALELGKRSFLDQIEREAPRVLLVDDSDDVRMLTQLMLEPSGFAVVGEAADGDEAVEATAAQRPDAIVMDLAMPRVDGITAIRKIKEQWPDVKIVVYTAFAKLFADELKDENVDGLVEKAAPTENLVEALQSVVD
ncbi:MAG: two-component system, chemotaxis family, chemotaxis protein CheY [Actinomycetota bacterium]|jgi:CheY-like chemotaxis protein|nr:two-component system, chemotaxis family, chemotaxis protein CheY [Actinomycetota bacterium]